jgi:hypothetical protein
MQQQDLLDLARIDVGPSGNDQVLLAIEQVVEAVGIPLSQIAGRLALQ